LIDAGTLGLRPAWLNRGRLQSLIVDHALRAKVFSQTNSPAKTRYLLTHSLTHSLVTLVSH